MRRGTIQSRRILGCFLLFSLVLLCLSSLPVAVATIDESAPSTDGDAEAAAEAVVDATGNVEVDEPVVEAEASTDDKAQEEETSEKAEADAKAKEAMRAAEAEMEAAKAAATEAAAAAEKKAKEAAEVAEEAAGSGTVFVENVAESAKSKALSFFGKAKEITPEKMKKVAAGALGVWGVAAGVGWMMNNFGGEE
mmetsp:Transcript_5629/g.12257  ORF Transcript_5629/g.12257 Transcript_5629/m.12257 type:complete len:194 (-) Transcript_5629:543-1124(-)|eukprot:CAMPEP_0171328208 /NCGR_PEP_ID=MMETSP0878-20121228/513_1 /TAXON_ID=67004 /ORGANISM="Thalassiosira weissflogii, Strain CCMP1336" /LENGTH=193 /DNA_ID=CAMNT_0011828041 /DNA_START=101 /DNA_END=682 /DNA_ORIENTATION=+